MVHKKGLKIVVKVYMGDEKTFILNILVLLLHAVVMCVLLKKVPYTFFSNLLHAASMLVLRTKPYDNWLYDPCNTEKIQKTVVFRQQNDKI